MKTGTKEWAETNLNIATGCEHNCRYCYARHNAVCRFKRVSADDWPKMVVSRKKVEQNYHRRDGVIMFPSSHDITPSILDDYRIVLEKLLDAGNKVLIITKPLHRCIMYLCNIFADFRKQITFRFSIGSMNSEVLRFWEPQAPSFGERYASLRCAYHWRYQTSVSAEPFLDGKVVELYERLKPYITDSFWIGKLRDFDRRVDMSEITSAEKAVYVDVLKKHQTDEAIMKLYEQLKDEPLVRWKDSIRKILGDKQ